MIVKSIALYIDEKGSAPHKDNFCTVKIVLTCSAADFFNYAPNWSNEHNLFA